jgi:tetratricopeptide (TPR) repeat protein
VASARDWLAIARAALDRLGSRQYLLGNLLAAEGDVLGAEHDYEGWVKKAREGAAVTAQAYGPDHYLSLSGLMNIGDTLSAAGRYPEAVAADRTALAAAERVLGPEHPLVAGEHNNLCEALNRSGLHAEALSNCQRAMDIWRSTGVDAVIRSYGQTGIGIALTGLGKPAEAIAPLQEAVAARGAAHLGGSLQGESRFALARALWKARPAARREAVALARQARSDSGGDARTVGEIERWLAKPE